MLAREVIGRQRSGCREAGKQADAIQGQPVPHLGDDRQPENREHESGPHPGAHRLAPDEPDPEDDQDRSEVLQQQGDPDRQPGDGHEVEPLDQADSDDPHHDQESQFARTYPQRGRADDKQEQHQDDGRAE